MLHHNYARYKCMLMRPTISCVHGIYRPELPKMIPKNSYQIPKISQLQVLICLCE